MLSSERWLRHRLLNAVQSLLLIGGMAGLLMLLGYLLFGAAGVWSALLAAGLLLALNPSLSQQLVLRLYRARPLSPDQAPELHGLVDELSRRAGLARRPQIFYIPSSMVNAFAVGTRTEAAIALTDGLLRQLDLRELAAVLAHEISHLQHNDLWVMGLADLFSRLTHVFALWGLLLLLINLPLMLFGLSTISWLAILVLIMAPSLSVLLQLGLSRTREYHADLGAAYLTGDPLGMARALQRLERLEGGWLEQLILPGRRNPEPSFLRTHPPTEERVRRLREISGAAALPRPLIQPSTPWQRPLGDVRSPRWRWWGHWY